MDIYVHSLVELKIKKIKKVELYAHFFILSSLRPITPVTEQCYVLQVTNFDIIVLLCGS